METSSVQNALSAIRDCALAMLENASYIQQELPKVAMDDELKSTAAGLCETMIGTKHDIIHELFEIDELLDSGAEPVAIKPRLDSVVGWMHEDMKKMHQLVMALRADCQQHKDHTMALVLVQESAVNILNAFNAARSAVETLASGQK